MPRFAASMMFLFQDLPPQDRFAAASAAGFRFAEHQNPYQLPAETVADGLNVNDLQMVLINAPAGDPARGERGLAALPGREADFQESFAVALSYAQTTNCPLIHVMSGVATEGEADIAMATYVENMRAAARAAAALDLTLCIEPINGVDIPGYLVQRTSQARALIAMIDEPNVGLQYDAYHALMNGEDPTEGVRANFDVICHMQVAGFPGRHEPGTGTFDAAGFFEFVDTLGYAGVIGCEYRPEEDTVAGLGWGQAYGLGGRRQPATTV